MQNLDFNQIVEGSSFVIQGGNKAGKMTFAFYMVHSLFKEKALIFTPQEPYLFRRRLDALKNQFTQFEDIENSLNTYYLKEDYKTLKQRYGFDFLIKEFTYIITNAEEKVIVVHRFGELFEFQDRYEIEDVYKTLVKIAHSQDKKILFVLNENNENFEHIITVADEFSDIAVRVEVNEENKRIIHMRDLLHNTEYPLLSFELQANTLLLDYHRTNKENDVEVNKNVLLCELDYAHDNLLEICRYIFDKPNFRTTHATSLQSILQEVFISPDIIIVFMKRTPENLQTVHAIKMHLPSSPIIAILEQEFVRGEDAQEAYKNGIDELFSSNLILEKLILATQKAAGTLFYSEAMEQLSSVPNKMDSIESMRKLASECVKYSIFFTLFVFKKDATAHVEKPSRKHDYVYEGKEKLYYIALNTAPKDTRLIQEKFGVDNLVCIWEPINHTNVEECLR